MASALSLRFPTYEPDIVSVCAKYIARREKGTLNPDHLDDRLEDGCHEVGACGKTDTDDGTARSYVLSSLLKRLLVDSNENNCVRPETVRCGLLYIGDDVFGSCKVDEYLAAELLSDHLLLLITSVNANDTTSHGLRILAS